MRRGCTDGFRMRKEKITVIWILMTDEAEGKRWSEGRGREQGYVRKR